jgi:hypothetical protein
VLLRQAQRIYKQPVENRATHNRTAFLLLFHDESGGGSRQAFPWPRGHVGAEAMPKCNSAASAAVRHGVRSDRTAKL